MAQGGPARLQGEAETGREEAGRMQTLRVLSEVAATLASEYDLDALLDRFLGMMDLQRSCPSAVREDPPCAPRLWRESRYPTFPIWF